MLVAVRTTPVQLMFFQNPTLLGLFNVGNKVKYLKVGTVAIVMF